MTKRDLHRILALAESEGGPIRRSVYPVFHSCDWLRTVSVRVSRLSGFAPRSSAVTLYAQVSDSRVMGMFPALTHCSEFFVEFRVSLNEISQWN